MTQPRTNPGQNACNWHHHLVEESSRARESPVGITQLFDTPKAGNRIGLIDGRDAWIGEIDPATQTCELQTRWGVQRQTVRYEVLERRQG